jgi:pyridoxal phosphate enzyme (YggS family)
MNIRNNITKFQQNLPTTCQLIVVSKTQPIERVAEAYEAGHRVFGENKVQEMVEKYEALPKDIEWHLIGHLQTNKVKYIAPFVHLIHSVDSVKLLTEINKQAMKVNRIIPCLLQVHIAREETKFGFSPLELSSIITHASIEQLKHIRIIGLMGMATFTDNEEQIANEFKELKNLFDSLSQLALPENVQMKELSMGMSSDYTIAAAHGSTFVRIGTAIFGERNYLNV